MSTVANLSVGLSANTAAFTEGMNKAAKTTREFKRGFSGLDLQLIKGGGAAAGITYAFRKLNQGLDELQPIVEKYARGQMSATEAINEGTRALVRNAPIVGEAFRAGEKLGEMYANLAQDVRDFNDAITNQEQKNAKVAASWKVYEKASNEATSTLQSLNRELALLNESDAGGKAVMQAGFAYEDAMKKAAGLREELEKIGKQSIFAERKAELEGQVAAIEASAAAMLDTQKRLAEQERTAPVSQMIQDLVREVEEFGVSAFDKMRKQVLDTFGPESAAFVDRYKAQLDALEGEARMRRDSEEHARRAAENAMRAQAKLMEQGRAVYESTRTEMEKHEAELTKLSDLLNAGAINWDTYARAVKQANEQLSAQNTIAEAPGARVVRFSQGMPGTRVDTQSKIEKNTKEQLDIAKKQYEALKTIAANKGGTSITVVDDGAFQ